MLDFFTGKYFGGQIFFAANLFGFSRCNRACRVFPDETRQCKLGRA